MVWSAPTEWMTIRKRRLAGAGALPRPSEAAVARAAGIGFAGPVVVGPFNAEDQALPPDERVATPAASLARIWPD